MMPELKGRPGAMNWYQSLAAALVGLLLMGCGAREPVSFQRPNGVAVAPDGSLYVMDLGNYRVVQVNPDGTEASSFGQLGMGEADIFQGWDIALDNQGNIVICNLVPADTGAERDGVKRFAPDGRLLNEIGGISYPEGDEVVSNAPYALETDLAGRVYLVDYGTNQVRVFTPDDRLLGTLFGESGDADGAFLGIADVAVDDTRGLLYGADSRNGRIQQFRLTWEPDGTPTAAHLRSFGRYGRADGEFAYPQNLTVDEATGDLYVSDIGNRRIQRFNSEGAHEANLSPATVADWQVLGLGLGPDGAIYAADALNNAIWVFERDGTLRQRIGREP